MAKSGRSKAEEFFAVTQKKEKKAQREKEKERQEMAVHVSKLRGLRLAKEAADKEAAEIVAAEKAAAKNKKKKKKPARLPQAVRQRP